MTPLTLHHKPTARLAASTLFWAFTVGVLVGAAIGDLVSTPQAWATLGIVCTVATWMFGWQLIQAGLINPADPFGGAP